MFTHSCTACEKRQLIFPSQIVGVAGTPEGQLSFSFTCWCGAEQTHVDRPAVAADRGAVTPA